MAASDIVVLRGGLAVPVAPLLLCLDLEARGFQLRTDGADILVQPSSLLTPEDRQQLRQWKLHVIELLRYEPPAPAWLQ